MCARLRLLESRYHCVHVAHPTSRARMTDFHGIFPYLVSPIDETSGRVREHVLRDLVEHLIGCGVHGLSPLGSTGEFAYLSFEQRQEIVRIVVDAAAGCVMPRECVRLYDLACAGEWEQALLEQRRQWAINEVFAKYALAACIKTALQLQGFDVGDAIAPQQALKPEAVEEIRRALAQLK
jgi:dihydrodipicolinate synthase/N-acetylneuraminate lyase